MATHPSSGSAPAGRPPLVSAATRNRWRRTWRSRLVAGGAAVVGVVGGAATIAHSQPASTPTTDQQVSTVDDQGISSSDEQIPAPVAPPSRSSRFPSGGGSTFSPPISRSHGS